MAVNVHVVTPDNLGEYNSYRWREWDILIMLVIVCQTIWHLIAEEHYLLS